MYMETTFYSSRQDKELKITIPYRRFTNKLKPSQLQFLYENFVLRCENDEKKLKYFFINSKEIKELKRQLKFELSPIKPNKNSSIDTYTKDNEFIFFNNKNSAIASLLFHIRNVFVHNRIYVSNTGTIELIDVAPKGKNKQSNRITMYAKVSSFSKLKQILLGIIDTQL